MIATQFWNLVKLLQHSCTACSFTKESSKLFHFVHLAIKCLNKEKERPRKQEICTSGGHCRLGLYSEAGRPRTHSKVAGGAKGKAGAWQTHRARLVDCNKHYNVIDIPIT